MATNGAVAVREPHPLLRPLLAGGYVGFVDAGVPRRFVLSATGSVALIIKISDPACRPPAFVLGAHDEHVVLPGDSRPSYLQVWLTPLGAYTLLGLPLDTLRDQVVELTDLFDVADRALVARLRDATSWNRRFALAERLLLGRLDRGPRPAPEVARAWDLLRTSGGGAPIHRVADEVGWSHKHLIDRFRRQVGLCPKTAARLMRFGRVLRRLDDRPSPPEWGRLAVDAGYTDQSHLIRDFHTFAGTTPTDFLDWAHRTRTEFSSGHRPAPPLP